MEINPEKMSTEMETLIYEQPSLKKYGTMKEFTLAQAGSSGDVIGGDGNAAPNDVSFSTDDNQQGGDFGQFGVDDSPNQPGGDTTITVDNTGITDV